MDKITASLDLSKTHVPLGHASFVYRGRLQRSWIVFYLVLMFWQLYKAAHTTEQGTARNRTFSDYSVALLKNT